MANNAAKVPFLRGLAKRNYCCGKVAPVGGTISEIKTTVLPNKLAVATAETGSPISRLCVIFGAGARHETPDNYGVTHTLRAACGLSTQNVTQFAIIRNIQQVGASLVCEANRETISYTLTGTTDGVRRGSEYLSEIASCQVFKPWEVSDLSPHIKLELATLPLEAKAIDLLHKAAFRSHLGNSLFCAKHRVGKISPETLQHYVKQYYGSNRTAIIGLGIDHEELLSYAKNIELSKSSDEIECSKFYGGEIRRDAGGEYAYIGIGLEGGKFCNRREAVGFQVLRKILGTKSAVRHGNQSASLLGKIIQGSSSTAVSAINASYADTGLFGLFIITPGKKAKEIVTQAVDLLRTASISEKDLQRAKNQLKLSKLINMEKGLRCVNKIGYQVLLTTKAHTPSEACSEIDEITIDDVKKCLQKVSKGKLAIASVGNIHSVPYLDELK